MPRAFRPPRFGTAERRRDHAGRSRSLAVRAILRPPRHEIFYAMRLPSIGRERAQVLNKLTGIPKALAERSPLTRKNKIKISPRGAPPSASASTLFVAPFEQDALLSVEGLGTSPGSCGKRAADNRMRMTAPSLPHSLGYTTARQAISRVLKFGRRNK